MVWKNWYSQRYKGRLEVLVEWDDPSEGSMHYVALTSLKPEVKGSRLMGGSRVIWNNSWHGKILPQDSCGTIERFSDAASETDNSVESVELNGQAADISDRNDESICKAVAALVSSMVEKVSANAQFSQLATSPLVEQAAQEQVLCNLYPSRLQNVATPTVSSLSENDFQPVAVTDPARLQFVAATGSEMNASVQATYFVIIPTGYTVIAGEGRHPTLPPRLVPLIADNGEVSTLNYLQPEINGGGEAFFTTSISNGSNIQSNTTGAVNSGLIYPDLGHSLNTPILTDKELDEILANEPIPANSGDERVLDEITADAPMQSEDSDEGMASDSGGDDERKDPTYLPEEDHSGSDNSDIDIENASSSQASAKSPEHTAAAVSADMASAVTNGCFQSDESSFSDEIRSPKAKRGRIRRESKAEWKITRRSAKSQRGKAHIDQRGKRIAAKSRKVVTCRCPYGCDDVSEDDRQRTFELFWNLDRDQKRAYLLKHTSVRPVKRRSGTAKRHRGNSYEYFFTVNGNNVRVCSKVFLKTLDINQDRVHGLHAYVQAKIGSTPPDLRGSHDNRPVKISGERIHTIKRFMDSLPVQESHYRRIQTRRQYLERGLSQAALYRMYKDCCFETGVEPTSESYFAKYFRENYNYGFGGPADDGCDICFAFDGKQKNREVSVAEQEAFNLHILRKNEAFNEKANDGKLCKEDVTFKCYSFDMEKNLLTPSSNVNAMYYKRKMCTYNFTILDHSNFQPYCYVWSENEGRKSSDEVASCIHHFLVSNVPPNCREIVFYSDTAAGQNRNQNVAAMFVHYLLTTNSAVMSINQKFMERGHSHMEVDGVHGLIEKKAKDKLIEWPNDWVQIIKIASKKSPIQVIERSSTDWLNWKQFGKRFMKNRRQLETGESVKWGDLKWIKYEKAEPNVKKKYLH